MLLNIIPVFVGSAIVSKVFTEFPWRFRIAVVVTIVILAIIGFISLPKSLSKEERGQL